MMKRITARNDELKAKRVMEWLWLRNATYDMVQIDDASRVPMSTKQREKFRRRLNTNQSNTEGAIADDVSMPTVPPTIISPSSSFASMRSNVLIEIEQEASKT